MTENKDFLVNMGNRISKRRRELKMTQEQLAERMDLSLQSISCIELGKKAIRPENLFKLCRILDLSADYVLSGEKNAEQLDGILRKLSSLSERDFLIVESLIDHFLNR